ncbi:hypothetical protein [Brevundimonas sp. SORGH_AS_0993]|uniref:hypothetical protein n=1 Tax=Brevundimonas sp. SORGH_AS_0993 TaxID=3041794 RepID=UPI00277FF74C|nr:hypothetical protein [Brevundimonas sp. SORGH_AS_0993]MDQ1153369.1 hypothetical protein [Brevundimonas sp. SORGH_AS_0993]
MSFSATEAAFEGFRVTRQNPLSVLVWAGLWLVGLIVAVMILGPMTMPYASEIEAAQGDIAALSPGAVTALSLGMLAVLPILLGLQAILAPAVYRAVYAPQTKRIGYLQFGLVELRTLGVVAVLAVLSIILNLVGEAAVGFSKQIGGIAAALAVNLAVFVFTTWISVRLVLTAPLVLRRKGLPFGDSWRMTAKVFWPVLGVFFLSLAMTLLVLLLLVLIGWPLYAALTMGGAMAAIPGLLLLLLMGLGIALVSVLLWAPFASVVQQLDTQG